MNLIYIFMLATFILVCSQNREPFVQNTKLYESTRQQYRQYVRKANQMVRKNTWQNDVSRFVRKSGF